MLGFQPATNGFVRLAEGNHEKIWIESQEFLRQEVDFWIISRVLMNFWVTAKGLSFLFKIFSLTGPKNVVVVPFSVSRIFSLQSGKTFHEESGSITKRADSFEAGKTSLKTGAAQLRTRVEYQPKHTDIAFKTAHTQARNFFNQTMQKIGQANHQLAHRRTNNFEKKPL